VEKAKNPPRTHTTIEMATARGQIHELTKTIDIVVQEHDIQVSICVVSSPEKVPKKKKNEREPPQQTHPKTQIETEAKSTVTSIPNSTFIIIIITTPATSGCAALRIRHSVLGPF